VRDGPGRGDELGDLAGGERVPDVPAFQGPVGDLVRGEQVAPVIGEPRVVKWVISRMRAGLATSRMARNPLLIAAA
jgi:hypothetical protein